MKSKWINVIGSNGIVVEMTRKQGDLENRIVT